MKPKPYSVDVAIAGLTNTRFVSAHDTFREAIEGAIKFHVDTGNAATTTISGPGTYTIGGLYRWLELADWIDTHPHPEGLNHETQTAPTH